MADSKISGLTPAVSVAGTEEIPANAAGVNYKITLAQLMAYIETAIAIALANGGTGSDLSATGPGFLQQATLGADVTVSPLIAADMPTGIDAAKIGGGLVSNTEFGYLDGVTSAIQTQLNTKADSPHKDEHVTGGGDAFAAGDLLDAVARLIVKVAGVAAGANGRRAINLTTGAGSGLSVVATDDSVGEQTNIALDLTAIDATRIGAGTVDNTEFGYLNGVTSAIQTQLNAKASTAHKSTHVASGGDAFVAGDLLDAVARVIVKNAGSTVYANGRRGLNFIGGSGVTITTTDSSADEHTNITIAASGGGGGAGAWTHIQTITLSSPASFDFTSIPSTYRHLVLIGSLRSADSGTGGADAKMRFNGDAGANYKYVNITSLSGSVSTGSGSSDYMPISVCPTDGDDANSFSTVVVNIPNYASASLYKNAMSENTMYFTGTTLDLRILNSIWLSTAAINEVAVSCTGNFVTGSTLSLYGIL